MKVEQQTLPMEVGEVGCQIELWRGCGGGKGAAMPEALWTKAAQLARRYGIYRISQALRLSYESLKRRVLALPDKTMGQNSDACRFVEVGIVPSPVPWGVEIELDNQVGQKVVIRLRRGSEIDLSWVAGCLGRSQR